MNPRLIRADALGFLAGQGQPPIADPALARHMDVMHVTVAPPAPNITTTQQILTCFGPFRDTVRDQGSLLRPVYYGPQLEQHLDGDDGRVALIYGLQQAPHDATLANLVALFNCGVRIMAIAYQGAGHGQHPYGGGFLDDSSRGLTDLGRQFLEDCVRVGMIVDLAHSNTRTQNDVLSYVADRDLPLQIMISHTGNRKVYQAPRNAEADIICEVAQRGGVIGQYCLTFGNESLDDSLDPVMAHLRFSVETAGPEAICLGTDAVYQRRNVEEWRKNFEAMRPRFDPDGALKARWPDQPLELNTPDVMGVLEQEINASPYLRPYLPGLLGGNLVRFLEAALPKE
jgi:membrane dipeptidase